MKDARNLGSSKPVRKCLPVKQRIFYDLGHHDSYVLFTIPVYDLRRFLIGIFLRHIDHLFYGNQPHAYLVFMAPVEFLYV